MAGLDPESHRNVFKFLNLRLSSFLRTSIPSLHSCLSQRVWQHSAKSILIKLHGWEAFEFRQSFWPRANQLVLAKRKNRFGDQQIIDHVLNSFFFLSIFLENSLHAISFRVFLIFLLREVCCVGVSFPFLFLARSVLWLKECGPENYVLQKTKSVFNWNCSENMLN